MATKKTAREIVIELLQSEITELLEPVQGDPSRVGGDLLRKYKMLTEVKDLIVEKTKEV